MTFSRFESPENETAEPRRRHRMIVSPWSAHAPRVAPLALIRGAKRPAKLQRVVVVGKWEEVTGARCWSTPTAERWSEHRLGR